MLKFEPMGLVIYNGEFLNDDKPVLPIDNRAFHYADGVFESFRVVNGKACFLPIHFKRALSGAEVMKISLPTDLTEERFEELVAELIEKNNIKAGGRGRFTLFRSGPGHYQPKVNEADYTIEMYAYADNEYTLNDEGFIVDIYPEIKKPVNMLSVFKSLNSQVYIMASLYCKQNDLNDCLLLNDKGNIIETSCANIFIVSNGVLYTPHLDDGCVGGTMRMQVINSALENEIKVYECSLTPQNLLAADEVFLTNAIKGIQWVSGYRTKRYFHKISDKLVEKINQKIPS